MRHRKLPRPQPAIDAAVAPDAPPGQIISLADELADLGVPVESIPRIEAVVYREAFRSAGETLRHVLLGMDRRSPAARALQVAILGLDGMTYEQHAAECGQTRGNFFRSVERVRERIQRRAA